jgi:hypothetical protein
MTSRTVPRPSPAGQVSEDAALVHFDFHGDDLEIVRAGAEVLVGVRAVCASLGVAFEAQIRKLKGDPSMGVIMMIIPSAGGAQETACLPIRSLPLWLATIHPSKVSAEVREKLIAYRSEAAEVLADHFIGPRRLPPAVEVPALPPASSLAIAAEDRVQALVLAVVPPLVAAMVPALTAAMATTLSPAFEMLGKRLAMIEERQTTVRVTTSR